MEISNAVQIGGLDDEVEMFGEERDEAVLSPTKGKTRLSSTVMVFHLYVYLISYGSIDRTSLRSRKHLRHQRLDVLARSGT